MIKGNLVTRGGEYAAVRLQDLNVFSRVEFDPDFGVTVAVSFCGFRTRLPPRRPRQ